MRYPTLSHFNTESRILSYGPPRRGGKASVAAAKKISPTLAAFCRSVTRNDMDLEGCITIGSKYGVDAAKNVF